MDYNYRDLPVLIRKLLLAYLILIFLVSLLGLYFVSKTLGNTPKGVVTRINGDESLQDEFTENFDSGKSINELIMTVHNHAFGFSFIFLTVGLIFYFNNIIGNKLKSFLMIEPFISIVTTFGSFFLIKFYGSNWVILTIISSVIMYLSLYSMLIISVVNIIISLKSEHGLQK